MGKEIAHRYQDVDKKEYHSILYSLKHGIQSLLAQSETMKGYLEGLKLLQIRNIQSIDWELNLSQVCKKINSDCKSYSTPGYYQTSVGLPCLWKIFSPHTLLSGGGKI